MRIQPIDFAEACQFVRRLHRHHKPAQGHKFSIAVNDGARVVGVLTAGRPVSRILDDGITVEVTRCCTDGTPNACSILYASAWRAARALGFCRMITHTLPDEGGASLRASGARRVAETRGGRWSRATRTRLDDHPTCPKWRWEWTAPGGERFAVPDDDFVEPALFDEVNP